MSKLNAAEVVGRLRELGHDYSPDRQAYKASIAGDTCELFDPNSLDREGQPAPVTVRASEADKYVAKGFLTARPVATGKKGK